MKTVLRTIIILLVGLAILAGAGYWAYKSLTESDEQQISQAAEEADEKLQEDTEPPKANEQVETVGLSEVEFQIHLHQMTHQKIEATEKRGAIEMTPERIDEMLKILRANEGAYEEYEFYERSLTTWEQGDFSNAVGVHNTIWEWHNGTVGRATGLLSEEQEAEYVENNF